MDFYRNLSIHMGLQPLCCIVQQLYLTHAVHSRCTQPSFSLHSKNQINIDVFFHVFLYPLAEKLWNHSAYLKTLQDPLTSVLFQNIKQFKGQAFHHQYCGNIRVLCFWMWWRMFLFLFFYFRMILFRSQWILHIVKTKQTHWMNWMKRLELL